MSIIKSLEDELANAKTILGYKGSSWHMEALNMLVKLKQRVENELIENGNSFSTVTKHR